MSLGIRILGLMMVVSVVAAGTACVGGAEPRVIPTPGPPEPTPAPRALSLPADDASHTAPIEWWYYNGHLVSDAGDDYSFHFVIFQTQNDQSLETFEIGQAGIADVSSGVHHHLSSDGFGVVEVEGEATDRDLVSLELLNFSLGIDVDGGNVLEAWDETSGTGFSLRMSKPETVMLHEGVGWMDWPFGWTYYYSYPRMRLRGR